MYKKQLQAMGALYGDGEPPKPSRKRRIGKKQTEAQLQKQCVAWFKMQYPYLLIHSTPNEGKRESYRGANLVAAGLSAGYPDLTIDEPRKAYHGLRMELKVGYNKLTERQKWWRDQLLAKRYAWYEVRSFEEFQLVVKNYLNLDPCST